MTGLEYREQWNFIEASSLSDFFANLVAQDLVPIDSGSSDR